MSNRATKSVRGFTLIELLIALALIALLSGPLIGFMQQIKTSYFKWEAAELELQTRIAALDQIARTIQEGLILSGSNAQKLELLVGADIIGFELEGSRILRYKNGNPLPLEDGQIAALRFFYPQPKMVYINMDGYLLRARSRQ
jgi:prepilin-type N-terminal cleavage/methylation domain-containing protein